MCVRARLCVIARVFLGSIKCQARNVTKDAEDIIETNGTQRGWIRSHTTTLSPDILQRVFHAECPRARVPREVDDYAMNFAK